MIRVQRRVQPPASLLKQKRPFDDDVKAALNEDFFGKCYLCESIASGSFDVEHLQPKADFPQREFDWLNLFLACSRCNERRKTWAAQQRAPGCTRWPLGGLLDCTLDNVDERLLQLLSTDETGVAVEFCARTETDLAAANTAEELNAIHSLAAEWGRQICALLHQRYTAVLEGYIQLVQEHRANDGDWHYPSVRVAQAALRQMLAPNAPFAGLIRARMRQQVGDWAPMIGL